MLDARTVYALWDGARLPDEVAGTIPVITYSGEISEHEASEVIGHVPLFVDAWPQ